MKTASIKSIISGLKKELARCGHANVQLGAIGQNEGSYRLYVGLRSDRYGTEFSADDALEILDTIFPGYTSTDAKGRWQRKNEPAIAVDLINCCSWIQDWEDFERRVVIAAQRLANALGQQQILAVGFPPKRYQKHGVTPYYWVLEHEGCPRECDFHVVEADGTRVHVPDMRFEEVSA